MSDPDAREWSQCGVHHQQAQLLRLARPSLAEKLAWLEDADAIVCHLQQERARRRAPGSASERPEP